MCLFVSFSVDTRHSDIFIITGLVLVESTLCVAIDSSTQDRAGRAQETCKQNLVYTRSLVQNRSPKQAVSDSWGAFCSLSGRGARLKRSYGGQDAGRVELD